MSTGPPPPPPPAFFPAGLFFVRVGLDVSEVLLPPLALAVRTREAAEDEEEAREELVSMEELVSSLIFLRAS